MNDITSLLHYLASFTQELMNNANNRYYGPYHYPNAQKYTNSINELSFEIREHDSALYNDLQWIRQHMFIGQNMLNLFALGRLHQILQLDFFTIKNASLWVYAHPIIADKCQKKFMDGHYADSVETAMKEIISRVRKFRADNGYAENMSEYNMMENSFAKDNTLLKFNNGATISEKNIQNGYAKMFIGAVQALRHPPAHENIDMTEADAARKLMFASDLMYKLDEAFGHANNLP